jgi:hypothetical protein
MYEGYRKKHLKVNTISILKHGAGNRRKNFVDI